MPEITLTPFLPTAVGPDIPVCVDIGVLPGTTWRVEARGPGVLNHEDLQRALGDALERQGLGDDYMQLQGSTATLAYDCAVRGFYRGTITLAAGYVDATAFGNRYARTLPGEADTAERRERERTREEEARKAGERRKAAEQVARTTLERMLNEGQLATLKEHNYFDVIGNLGTRYRIEANAYSGNIYWIDETGFRAGNFCAHPDVTGKSLDGKRGRLPVSDSVIGQKLMLETDEARFLSLANLFGGEYPPVVSRGQVPPATFPEGPGAAPENWIPWPGCDCRWCAGTGWDEAVPADRGNLLRG